VLNRMFKRYTEKAKKAIMIAQEEAINLNHDYIGTEQLTGIIKGLKLKIDPNSKIFSRCTLCNTLTKDIAKKEVKKYVPPHVFSTKTRFVYCASCKKYYWRGTHWQKMTQKIQKLSLNESGKHP